MRASVRTSGNAALADTPRGFRERETSETDTPSATNNQPAFTFPYLLCLRARLPICTPNLTFPSPMQPTIPRTISPLSRKISKAPAMTHRAATPSERVQPRKSLSLSTGESRNLAFENPTVPISRGIRAALCSDRSPSLVALRAADQQSVSMYVSIAGYV